MLDFEGNLEHEHVIEPGIIAIKDNNTSDGTGHQANISIISSQSFEGKAFDRLSEDDDPLLRTTFNYSKILKHAKYLHKLHTLLKYKKNNINFRHS